MAAEKSADKKIMDVARPGKTSAEPTSRPVIVTNRPLITQDPMVSGESGNGLQADKKPATKAEEPLTPHAEKVIKPPKATDDAEADKEEKTEPEEDTAKDAKATDTDDKPEEETKEPESETEPEKEAELEEPTPEPANDSDEFNDDKQVSPEAVEVAEENKRRKAELEEIIASGKYNVPINSSGKKRTRIITFWLIVLTVLLAVVLVDALLDVGIISVDGIPHTNFFGLPPAD